MTAGRRTRGMCSRVFVSQERAMVAEPTYLAPGVVLQDRYTIADEIGRGGFSIVYRARDRRVGTDVAIKLLVPPPAAARLARERLRREVQAVRQLSHPNIVAVYDVVDDGPWSFVVMERSEERRVGKGVDLGGRRIIKKKKERTACQEASGV